MTCQEVRENLIEMLTEGPADPSVTAHVRECSACSEELKSLRATMALMDEWEAPEPSPYFLTRLQAHVKEEREKAPARTGIFSWMRRPVMAMSMATVLLAGGLAVKMFWAPPPETTSPNPVADVEALERNHDVLVNTDLIDELSGGPSDDVSDE